MILVRTQIELTINIEETDVNEIFILSPHMKVNEVIRFIQHSDYKGATYCPKDVPQTDAAMSHDLVLIPPSAIGENGYFHNILISITV